MKLLLVGLSGDRVENHLLRALHEIPDVTLQVIAAPDSEAAAICTERHIPCVTHAFTNRFDRRAVRLYLELTVDGSVQLIHCLTNRSLSTALLATRHLRHPPKMVAYRGTIGHLSRFDVTSWMAYPNPRIAAIVCVSNAVRRYLRTFQIPADKLPVIWKGHDPSWYPPPATPAGLRADFHLPPDAVTVGFTGNMRPVKGVLYLLKAFQNIAPSENIHLFLIGEVRDPHIASFIGTRPHIHFLGYRADASRIAGACDMAIMPSISREGLPKALIEAMIQGVTPIATAVGGLPELVENEVSGILIPPKNATAIREAIQRLARNPALRQRMGRAARDRILGPFHFSHTLQKTLALYHSLCQEPP